MVIILTFENQATIGVDFATKTIEYNENSLKLQMWDSAGLERYRALIPSYVRGASIIFIVYDISSKESFNNLTTWINFIKQINTDNSLVVLCGNKIDLERKVLTEEGKNLANKEKLLFFEVSARKGDNVNRMMYTCIAEMPFFEQFKIEDKEGLIKDLEGFNNKKELNSIYDIEKDKNNENQGEIKVMKQNENKNEDSPQIIVVQKKKKKHCC